MGSAFVRLLDEKNLPHCVVNSRNYRDFVGKRCDVLINADGNARRFLAERAPAEEFDASVRSVCHLVHDIRCAHYVHISSCCVYSDVTDPTQNHEDVDIDVSRQTSRYGFHKYLAERIASYEIQDCLIVRLGGVVGPNLTKNPIYDILHGGPLFVDPTSRFQYILTDDVARIVWELIERSVRREVFNICGDGPVELQEVIDYVGRPVHVKPGSPREIWNVNIDKIKRLFSIPCTRQTVFGFVDEYRRRPDEP